MEIEVPSTTAEGRVPSTNSTRFTRERLPRPFSRGAWRARVSAVRVAASA
jgi:hypothetical protein